MHLFDNHAYIVAFWADATYWAKPDLGISL